MHPFVDLLHQRRIACLWAGLALSALGGELGRMAILWLAIEQAGPAATLLPMAQYAVILAVSLGAGLFADRWSARATLIATDLLSAAVVLAPVLLAPAFGVALSGLLVVAMLLAALHALFQPALLTSIPAIAGSRERIQGVNALLDATTRLARLGGPFLAGLLSPLLPVLHLLTLNALGFLASAAAIAAVGRIAAPAPARHAADGAVRRLLRGIELLRAQPEIRVLLLANTLVLAAWTVGVSLGLPFLVAQTALTGFGLAGLGAVAALVAAYGAGDFVSNFWVASRRPMRPGRFMFGGYLLLGGALALLPLPLWWLPAETRLAAMIAAAFASGLGGPMFFIPMMTLLQTRLVGADLAAVVRLRLALTAAAMVAGSGLGALLFDRLGAAPAVLLAGLAVALVGAWGWRRWPDLGAS